MTSLSSPCFKPVLLVANAQANNQGEVLQNDS
jgi:hypothetical protein